MKLYQKLAGLMAIIGLTGCAVINPPKPLPAPAAATAPLTTLKQAGLSHPKTVYVPAFYTGGQDNLLFINGQRYRSPNGAGNTMGFIPTANGYVVAVENVPVPTTVTDWYGYPVGKLQAAAKLELFKVTKAGKTLGEIAHLDLKPYDQVFQTRNAFYIQRLSGVLHERPAAGDGEAPLFSYFGLNTAGHRVSGPSNVLFATPAATGGWYKIIPTGTGVLGGYSGRELLVQNGAIVKSTLLLYSFSQPILYLHSKAMFVNMPPVVDSILTGCTLQFAAMTSPIDRSQITDEFGVNNLAQPHTFGLQYAMSTTGLSPSQGYYFLQREALFGTPAAPYVVRQLGTKSFGGTVSEGYMDVLTGTKTPVFALMGGTTNVLRKLLGSNNTSMSTSNGQVDAFTVITPMSAILIDANQGTVGTGYDVATRQQISAAYAQEFASQYGMMP